MGDHRASIKIEFSMYGDTHKADMWINWSPNSSEVQDIDQRVLDFFRQSYLDMYAKHWETFEEAMAKQRKKAEEEAERKEYERLKAKFEGNENE